MILYLDTSALVKLYIEEPGTQTVERAVREAQDVTTCWLSYPEARSAFSRLAREGIITADQLRVVVTSLHSDLPTYDMVLPEENVFWDAGYLADRRGIRALDAIHLAAASSVSGEDVRMLTFDERLLVAAKESMLVYEA